MPTDTKKASTKKTTTKKKTTKKKTTAKRKPSKPKDITIVSPIHADQKMVVASEFADDAIIEQEMSGDVLPHFIYSFEQQGKTITGLSVKGVNETVRRLNRDKKSGYKISFHPDHMRVERDVVYNDEKGVEVTVLAENIVDGNRAWGIKFEPYMKTGKNGKYANTFAVEKALSKAERNAKRKLIPEVVATNMIAALIKEGNEIQSIEAPQEVYRSVMPAQPRASTPQDLQTVIENAIKNAKSVDDVIYIDEKAQDSDKLKEDVKKKIHIACNKRVSELEIT